MKVLSVGAGAVGGTVAARLARSGIDLCVADANVAHVAACRDPGIRIGGLDDGEPTPLDAYVPSDLGDEAVAAADVVLLAVRWGSTRDALAWLGPHLRDDADVVSLQNGLNEDVIASIVGADRTVGCVVGFGATWIDTGSIELDADGTLQIGRLGGPTDARLEQVHELLSHAFATRVTDNVTGALWGKLLVNSMTVLGALGGMITGDVLGTPARRRLVADVVAEGVRVAKAHGVELGKVFGIVPADEVDGPSWHDAMEDALLRVREAAGAIRSVTWRDFELGRPTEIDAVTGEIVRRGKTAGVPTPLASEVYRVLRDIEAGSRSPAPDNIDGLVAASR